MIKDKLNISTLDVDLSKPNIYSKEKFKSLDVNSRFKRFRFFYNSIMLKLDNITIRAYMVKPDSKEIFKELTILDNNIVELEFTSQYLAYPGTLKLELVLYEDDSEISSFIIEFEVIKSLISNNSIESSNEYTALSNSLREVKYWNREFRKKNGELETLYTNRLNTIENKIINLSKNVKEFGAVGDGITDDTLAIQNAIKSIINDTKDNKNLHSSLYFPAGEYVISDTIDIVENTMYYGDGRSTILSKKNVNLNKPIFRLKEKDTPIPPDVDLGSILGSKEAEKYLNVNITIKDLTFDGKKDFEDLETIAGADGLLLSGFFKLELDNVYVKNFKGSGFNFHTSRLSNTLRMINTFVLQNNEFGVYTTGSCGDFHILLCDIGSSRLANVNFEATGSTIKDSVIWNSIEDCGIVTSNDLVNITNCNVEGNARHQILVWNNSHVMISGNRIYAGRFSGTSGIYCDNTLKSQENIVITNNNIISSIVPGWPTFAKAATFGPNHKNFTFKGNSVKYLGNAVEDKSKKPYVEGLSLANGDVWDEIGELHYIKTGLNRTTLTPGTYTNIKLSDLGYDLSNLLVDGKIHIREDGVYNLSGALKFGFGDWTNPTRINLSITKANGNIEKHTIVYTNIGQVSKFYQFSLTSLLESGDIINLEGTTQSKNEIIEENLELSYFILTKN